MNNLVQIIRLPSVWKAWYYFPEYIRVILAGIFFYGWFLAITSNNKPLAIADTLLLFVIGVSKILFEDEIQNVN
jgi:hypothetical protein